MDGVRAGGQRRIDRVLDEGYLAGLSTLSLADVRALRVEADQEETDLSYLRRLLQARLDLVAAEVGRRERGEDVPADVIAHLTAVLGDSSRSAPHGLGRHAVTEPSRAGESRRYVEQLVSDALLTDLPGLDDPELGDALARLRTEEGAVSARRAAVHEVLDAVTGEIARRYRDGEASVDSLLAESRGAEN